MRLSDVAMVAADTSRSRAYLQALVRNGLFPSYVLVLGNDANSPLPGQYPTAPSLSLPLPSSDAQECWSETRFNVAEPILTTLATRQIPHAALSQGNINDALVVDTIRKRPESVFIYSGYGGVLLRREVLHSGKRFLHVHGGYLPAYKGSTANYFSLIEEGTLGASALFLSRALDSGPILHRQKFPPPTRREEIDHIYDPGARAKVLVETLQKHVAGGFVWVETPDSSAGETYYIIHPVLKHIAILSDLEGSVCE